MRQVHHHCKKNGLDIPYFAEEDLDKSLWRLIKEQSLTLANLQPHIVITHSPLFNQETMVSGSMETFGNDNFDLKNILLAENDNLTPITALLLKFPQKTSSVVNTIELPEDLTGWQAAGYYSVLREFNKNWRDDIVVDVSQTGKDGVFKHTLKAASANDDKLQLIKKEIEKMNEKVENELGVPIKKITVLQESTQLAPHEDQNQLQADNHQVKEPQNFQSDIPRNKLFFTGKKIELLFMMQALQRYLDSELKTLKEATFTLDYVFVFVT